MIEAAEILGQDTNLWTKPYVYYSPYLPDEWLNNPDWLIKRFVFCTMVNVYRPEMFELVTKPTPDRYLAELDPEDKLLEGHSAEGYSFRTERSLLFELNPKLATRFLIRLYDWLGAEYVAREEKPKTEDQNNGSTGIRPEAGRW